MHFPVLQIEYFIGTKSIVVVAISEMYIKKFTITKITKIIKTKFVVFEVSVVSHNFQYVVIALKFSKYVLCVT